jgi:hypothetical protein
MTLPTAVRSNGGYWIQGGPGPEVLGMKSPQAPPSTSSQSGCLNQWQQ